MRFPIQIDYESLVLSATHILSFASTQRECPQVLALALTLSASNSASNSCFLIRLFFFEVRVFF
jgi:hypothetical protein